MKTCKANKIDIKQQLETVLAEMQHLSVSLATIEQEKKSAEELLNMERAKHRFLYSPLTWTTTYCLFGTCVNVDYIAVHANAVRTAKPNEDRQTDRQSILCKQKQCVSRGTQICHVTHIVVSSR